MIRDFANTPYRRTAAYARAVAAAAIQKARMHHRVGTLWPSQSGQSTSGAVRRPWFGYAV